MKIDYNKSAFIIGRFQPITKGHNKMINELKKFKTSYVFIVKGKKSSKDKNPFDFELQKEMFNKIIPKAKIIKLKTGYFIDKLKELNEKDFYLLCGKDRYGTYNNMLKYLEDKNVNIIKFSRDDNISATKVRNYLIEDNKNEFEKITPTEIHSFYNVLKNNIKGVNNEW